MEHAHLQQQPDAMQPKVNHDNVPKLAIAACKNIPGAAEKINNYFNNADVFERIPRPQIHDQVRHLGFGTTY